MKSSIPKNYVLELSLTERCIKLIEEKIEEQKQAMHEMKINDNNNGRKELIEIKLGDIILTYEYYNEDL